MERRAASLITLALLACRPGSIPADDEAGGSSSSSSGGSSEASSSAIDSSTASATGEGGSSDTFADDEAVPDLPADLPTDPTAPPPEGCVDVDLLDAEGNPSGAWSGWTLCDGAFFRVEALDCPLAQPYPACDASEPECDECLAGESCLDYYGDSGYCFCGRNCTSDVDCGRGEICVCAAAYGLADKNTCLPAACDDELDCASVDPLDIPHCRLDTDLCHMPLAMHCRTELDACIYDGDCPGSWCRYDTVDERWTCDEIAICE
jgi:hypothetical protein